MYETRNIHCQPGELVQATSHWRFLRHSACQLLQSLQHGLGWSRGRCPESAKIGRTVTRARGISLDLEYLLMGSRACKRPSSLWKSSNLELEKSLLLSQILASRSGNVSSDNDRRQQSSTELFELGRTLPLEIYTKQASTVFASVTVSCHTCDRGDLTCV